MVLIGPAGSGKSTFAGRTSSRPRCSPPTPSGRWCPTIRPTRKATAFRLLAAARARSTGPSDGRRRDERATAREVVAAGAGATLRPVSGRDRVRSAAGDVPRVERDTRRRVPEHGAPPPSVVRALPGLAGRGSTRSFACRSCGTDSRIGAQGCARCSAGAAAGPGRPTGRDGFGPSGDRTAGLAIRSAARQAARRNRAWPSHGRRVRRDVGRRGLVRHVAFVGLVLHPPLADVAVERSTKVVEPQSCIGIEHPGAEVGATISRSWHISLLSVSDPSNTRSCGQYGGNAYRPC